MKKKGNSGWKWAVLGSLRACTQLHTHTHSSTSDLTVDPEHVTRSTIAGDRKYHLNLCYIILRWHGQCTSTEEGSKVLLCKGKVDGHKLFSDVDKCQSGLVCRRLFLSAGPTPYWRLLQGGKPFQEKVDPIPSSRSPVTQGSDINIIPPQFSSSYRCPGALSHFMMFSSFNIVWVLFRLQRETPRSVQEWFVDNSGSRLQTSLFGWAVQF